LVILGLAAAGATALYIAGPSELVRDQIVARVKAETGRDLIIKGPAAFTVYPSLGVNLGDVSLSAPPGMTAPPLLTTRNLTVSVALMPLLKREVEIEKITFDQPVLSLQVDATGQRSWDFADAGPPAGGRVRLAQAEQDPAIATDAPPSPLPGAGGARPTLQRLTFGDIRISRGSLLYVDQRNGAFENISGIDLAVAVPALDATATANGKLNWRGATLDLAAEITSPAQLMQSSSARLVTSLSGAPIDVRYEGTLAFGAALDAEGNFALKSPSLHRLLAFAQKQTPTDAPERPVNLTGKLTASDNTFTLSGATGAIDRTRGSGDIAVTTGGARPIVRANLKFAELDLNAILGNTTPGEAAPPPPSPTPAGAAPPDGQPPQSIEDLLNADTPPAPGPKVRGFSQSRGWSNEPYDFALLNVVDASARLSIGRLLYKELKVGQSMVAVALKGSVLTADFTDVQLYGGRGKGLLAIDASDAANPRMTTNISLEGVQGLPLLKDAADLDWLSGTGKIVLGVTGNARSQRALMTSLGGSADLSFTDGAIVGVNIPGMLRNASQGKLGGLDSAPTEKTDFSQLTSSWAINNGVARNNDLKLVGPLIRVTGEGAVKLGERALDYTLRPKLVAEPKGQGGTATLAGIEVPVRIQGAWEKPKFAPDFKGLLKDPDKAVETIKELGKQFKGKDAKEVLKDIFGGGNTAP
jgi:AsmA protein